MSYLVHVRGIWLGNCQVEEDALYSTIKYCLYLYAVPSVDKITLTWQIVGRVEYRLDGVFLPNACISPSYSTKNPA